MRASAVPSVLLTAALACLSAPLWAQALDHGERVASPAAGAAAPCLGPQTPLPAELRPSACLLLRGLDAAAAVLPRGPVSAAHALR